MRCPICSAIVTGGEVCQNCGASLPANMRSPRPGQRRGGLLSSAVKRKRPGTLGDMFRSGVGALTPENKPQRQRKEQQPKQPQREAPPARRGVQGARQVAEARRRADREPIAPPASWGLPAPATPPPPPPGRGASAESWASSYDAAFAAPPATPPAPPSSTFGGIPADVEGAWQADAGWGVAAPPVPPPFDGYDPYDPYYDPYGAAPAGTRPEPGAFPQADPWGGDPYAMGAPMRPMSRTRRAVSSVTRLTVNVTMVGLVLMILAIASAIGLRHVQNLRMGAGPVAQPTATVAPTAVPSAGFTGLQAELYSISYPTQWGHHQTSNPFGCSCGPEGEAFSDGANVRFVIYTRSALPADQLADLPIRAAATVAPQQPPQALQLDQHPTYGGSQWMENDYTVVSVVGDKQVPLQVRVLVINFNATTYIVVASAPQSDFAHDNSAFFEPMLRSFRFD